MRTGNAMNHIWEKYRGPVVIVVALAVAAWAGGIAEPRPSLAAAAPSTPSPTGAPASGPAAPPGFSATVERIYSEALSYSGLPGLGPKGQTTTTAAPMSVAAFNKMVSGLSPDQLNRLYDYKPDAWPRVDATLATYTKTAPPSVVASQIAQAYAASASATKPAAAPRRRPR